MKYIFYIKTIQCDQMFGCLHVHTTLTHTTPHTPYGIQLYIHIQRK